MIHDLATIFKRPGRPRGKAKVGREQNLRLHDIALMRSILQGVDLRRAALRYLPEIHADLRVVQGHVIHVVDLCQDILIGMQAKAQANALGLVAKVESNEKSGEGMEQVQTPPSDPVSALPTLDAFAEEIGADDFSEAELIELYHERYGSASSSTASSVISSLPSTAPSQQKMTKAETALALDGLRLVQSRGLMVPKASDPVDLWFSANLADHLKRRGVMLIYNLLRSINLNGKHWYKRFPGIGVDRARRIVAWLVDHEAFIGIAVHPRSRWEEALEYVVQLPVDASATTTELASGAVDKPVAVTNAAEALTEKNAAQGTGAWSLRADGHNALQADDDVQAVKTWLETLVFKAENTRKAYARDVQRLLLWAQERGKTLSTLSVSDASAHAHFLRNPPEHWVATLPTLRKSADWRPMRGALSPASTARALAAIGHLYGFLMETGYLRANPFSRIKAQRAAGPLIDTLRSFSSLHMQVLVQALRAMPDDAAKRRLQALLMLMEATGVRIGELDRTWADVTILSGAQLHAEVGDKADRQWCLRVLGKGGKERLIPLKPHVIEALELHRQDRLLLQEQGLVPALLPEEMPLISVIGKPVGADLAKANGGLSSAGIHRVVKSLYLQASVACEDPEMRVDFRRATAHWMRHTFAHNVLKASDKDLPVTQQLLGHGSIATTGIYLKASMVDRLRAVQAMPDFFQENDTEDHKADAT